MKSKWLPAALVALFLCPAGAAEVTLVATQELAFGAFVAGQGAVTVAPGLGARSSQGGVILLSSGSSSAATFTATGDEDATYAITLPANNTVSLSSGGNTMQVNEFTSSPGEGGTFRGPRILSVGATLEVGQGQPPGSYSGSFTVTVDYN